MSSLQDNKTIQPEEMVRSSTDIHPPRESTKPPAKDSRESFGIACPRCGGSLQLHQGQKSILCEYCNSALYLQNPPGVKSFMTKPRISAGKAKLATLHYLREKTAGLVKARHTSIKDIQLVHVPFWRIRGRLVGWISGEKAKMVETEVPTSNPQSLGTRKITREERRPFSKMVFKNIHWSTPACTLPYLGLQGISLKTKFLKWNNFSHRFKQEHTFALPMKSAEHASSNASNYFSHLVTPQGATLCAKRFHLFDSDMALYYYPVYFIRYQHGKRIYPVTVDGWDGHVIRGRFPVKDKVKARNIFFLPAVAALMACSWFPLLIISLVTLYLYDLISGEGTFLPHTWIMGRLKGWFGGE
jgi:DNA-directed RNA polymerase subunit RPC12/RpoP